MRSDTDTEPLEFAAHFLQLHGAAVERDGAFVDALVPEDLQASLDVPEFIRLSGGGTDPGEESGHYGVTYGTPLLERMIGGAMEAVPLSGCRMEFDYVKSGGFERLLQDQLAFYGAVASIETMADVSAAYVLVVCRYTAASDEQKEGLLPMVFNADTGLLVPGMEEAMEAPECRRLFVTPGEKARQTLLSLVGPIEQEARRLLASRLESFRQSMNRRFQRDIANLEAYYASLEKEMQKSLERPGLSENAVSDRRMKIEALPAELASQADDLLKKYSIRVRLLPAAAMHIRTPAKKIVCRLAVGRRRRQFSLIYNPVSRGIDPPACSRCHAPILHIHFDENLESICFPCK